MTREENSAFKSPRRFVVSVVNIMHALGHVNIQGIPILYPALRDHFALGYMEIAFLALVRQLVMGPMQISFGILTRLARRFHILAVGNMLSFIGTLAMAISQSYSHLIIGTATRSFGITPYHPVGGAIMASIYPKDQAKALGLYQTVGSIGSLAAPLVVGALLHVLGWRTVIFILGIPFFIASILCFSVKEPSGQADIKSQKKGRDRFGFQEYKAVFQHRNTLILSLTMMVGAGGRGGGVIQTYLAILLVDRFGISASYAALLFAAFTFGGVLGPLSMGWFSDRTSSLLATRLNLLFSALFVLLILSPTDPGILLALYVFFAGFFIKSRSSLLQTLLIQSGTQDARIDTQLSLYFSIGAVSGPIWTLLIGVLVDQYGMAVSMWTMAASYIFGMAILSIVRLGKDVNRAVASGYNP